MKIKPLLSGILSYTPLWNIMDGKTGFLVKPYYTKSIYEAVSKILSDETLARAMGHRAKEEAKKRFMASVICEKTSEAYRAVLSEKLEISCKSRLFWGLKMPKDVKVVIMACQLMCRKNYPMLLKGAELFQRKRFWGCLSRIDYLPVESDCK